MYHFEQHLCALAQTDRPGTGHRTCRILQYMAHDQGTQDWLARLRAYGILQNKHGVDEDMHGVNLFLHQCRTTGVGGNKSDACDVVAVFAVWLQRARQCGTDLVALQALAKKHGREVYLELRVMGGDSCAAACGQEALGVLDLLTRDVGVTWQDIVASKP
tara:strand:- start:7018 stop:7497 length:480 start_codon:yes stop_codon:yes gene_type:complete